MRNLLLLCLLAGGAFVFGSCGGQRAPEEAISTPIEVPVEGTVMAQPDGTAANLDTIQRDNTDVATTSGRGTPPSR